MEQMSHQSSHGQKVLGTKLNKNVYNFGIGGYGILQYAQLFPKAIEMKPEVILIGLYLLNDLADVCERAIGYSWYQTQIDFSRCSYMVSESDPVPQRGMFKRGLSWVHNHSAILSILSRGYSRLIREINASHDYLTLKNNGKLQATMLLKRKIQQHMANGSMNHKTPHIQLGYQALQQFLLNAKEQASLHHIRLGVMIIPSIFPVLHDSLHDSLTQTDPNISKDYHALIKTEKELTQDVSAFLKEQAIPFIDVLPKMKDGVIQYGNMYPIDGHPNETGYRIYAEGALELYLSLIEEDIR